MNTESERRREREEKEGERGEGGREGRREKEMGPSILRWFRVREGAIISSLSSECYHYSGSTHTSSQLSISNKCAYTHALTPLACTSTRSRMPAHTHTNAHPSVHTHTHTGTYCPCSLGSPLL